MQLSPWGKHKGSTNRNIQMLAESSHDLKWGNTYGNDSIKNLLKIK